MFNLKNKNAIITGSSRGIGKSIAKKLASNGCNLFLLSRNIDDLINVKNEISNLYKVNINCYSLDISNYDDVQTTFQKITNNYIIDILINNAGITKDNLLLKMSSNDWNSVIDINLTGYFNCSKCIIKQMIKQRNGKIINCRDWINELLLDVTPLAEELDMFQLLQPIESVLTNGNQSMIWLNSYSKGVSIQSLLQTGIGEMEREETNFMKMNSTY